LLKARRVKKTRQHAHKNIVGPRVRAARKRTRPRVSQNDLSGRLAAQKVQITQTSLSKLENQERYVMDYEVAAIAKALRVSISWLYGESR
jgi:transcriptional regulator with XRE-family HTH domain